VEDVAKAEVIIVIGSNPTVRNGTKLIAMDPIRTEICPFRDLFAAVPPGYRRGAAQCDDHHRIAARQDLGLCAGRYRPAAGSVFMLFCYNEASANLITNETLDPYGKIPEFKFCAVKLTPAEHCQSGSVN
jgi:predicted molibdopterin-dependent oxidoreductase YjgC